MHKLISSAARVTCFATALGAAAVLLAPAKQSYGFSKLGTALNVGSERDWRMHNIFADGTANNNTTPDTNYPGWFGADMAMWKAAAEWGNRSHGNGAGDPTQGNIGDGDSNFDFFFGGAASGAGNGQGIVSVLPNCGGGGTLAYVTNGGNAWNMRFCDEWSWADGPGNIGFSQFDIQAVGCHELGHSLGLGHSSNFAATMEGSIGNGATGERSINGDDIAGLQCIYGATDASKPTITGISLDLPNNLITVNGFNFSATGNALWFTSDAVTAPGTDPRVRVFGLDSPTGTQIVAQIPAGAGPGDVHVRSQLSGGRGLSNGWPVDPSGAAGPMLSISGVSPSSVACLIPGPDETVTITGVGFTPNTAVTIDGIALDISSYTFVNSSTITLDMPQVSQLGTVEVRVDEGGLSDTSSIDVFAPTQPTLQIGNGIEDLNLNPTTSSNGLDWIYAGTPGEFHYILGSGSNLLSTIPIVSLSLGNNFSDLFAVTNAILPPEGYLEGNSPFGPTFAAWWFQSLSFSQGTPIPVSNRQETLVTP